MRAGRGDAPAVEQRGAVGERDRRRAGARPPARCGRRGSGAGPARRGLRCARRAPTAGRRARARAGGRRSRAPARVAGAGRPRARAPARRSGCRDPTGRSYANVACATSSAASMSASVASGCPISRFSRTLAENSVGSSNANPTCRAQAAAARCRAGRARRACTRPAVGSCSRASSVATVVLPAPVAPTSASVSPGWISRSTPRSTVRSRARDRRSPHPRSDTSPRARTSVARVRAIGDERLGVEHLPHPARRRLGLLGHREDPRRAPRSARRGSGRTR